MNVRMSNVVLTNWGMNRERLDGSAKSNPTAVKLVLIISRIFTADGPARRCIPLEAFTRYLSYYLNCLMDGCILRGAPGRQGGCHEFVKITCEQLPGYFWGSKMSSPFRRAKAQAPYRRTVLPLVVLIWYVRRQAHAHAHVCSTFWNS